MYDLDELQQIPYALNINNGIIPYKQSIFVTETTNGNCLATTIASVLKEQVEYVPNVETLMFKKLGLDFPDSHLWSRVMRYWLQHKHNMVLAVATEFRVFHDETPTHELRERIKDVLKDKIYFISGKTTRDTNHITIWCNGKMIHDVHPSGDGLTNLDTFETLEYINDYTSTYL